MFLEPRPVVIHTEDATGAQSFIGGLGGDDTIIFDYVATPTATGSISIGLAAELMAPWTEGASANVVGSQLNGSTLTNFENIVVLQSAAEFTNVFGDNGTNRIEVHSTGHSSMILAFGGDDSIFVFAETATKSTFVDAGKGVDYVESWATAGAVAVIEENPAINGAGSSGNDTYVLLGEGEHRTYLRGTDSGSDTFEGFVKGRDIINIENLDAITFAEVGGHTLVTLDYLDGTTGILGIDAIGLAPLGTQVITNPFDEYLII